MPSSYFTLSPWSGSGNATASVTATTVNTGTTDNIATITISNGAKTRTVSAKQLYKPYFVQGSNQVPASGGTLTFVVHTEYDIAFIYSADWYSIKQNGNTIPTRTVIAPSNASGATFTIQVNENTATNARSASFPMVHYIRGNMVVSGYLTINQEAASGGRIAVALIPGSLVLDYMAGQSGTTTVSLSGVTSASVSASDTANFSINPTGSVGNNTVITVQTLSENIYHGDRVSNIQLTTTLGTNTATCVATQRYKPYFVQSGTTLPASGGRVTFTAYTEYDIFFSNIPSWATVTFNGSVITEGQRITAYAASGATFTITAEENTGSSRNATNFSMGCYVGQNPVSGVQNITLTQDGGQATVYATSITLNVESVIYESGTATVTVGPTGANTNITYTSSDPTIATIDNTGAITVLQDGIITICAIDTLTGLRDCKTVQVYLEKPGYITFSNNTLTFDYAQAGGDKDHPDTWNEPTGVRLYLTGFTSANVTTEGDYQAFVVNPTGNLSNNTYIRSYPAGENTGHTDNIFTLKADAFIDSYHGEATCIVRQKYRPYFETEPGDFPVSGGTLHFTAHTEYDIEFTTIPWWITVKLNGNTVSGRISAAVADGAVFTMEAADNSSNPARSGYLWIYHYDMEGQGTHPYDEINVSQVGGIDLYFAPTRATVYADVTQITYGIRAVGCTWDRQIPTYHSSSNPDFPVTYASWDDSFGGRGWVIQFGENTGATRSTTITYIVHDTNNNTFTHEVQITQLAPEA